ncbi:M20 family metallopeptidase [Desulfofundulus thermosubterraneus]|uniref:Succinyl-diaminopimelate desuccinylase n=1 Tax=Desulfofundulus thermosubterraneus DSM 16057 TaxID=1121432 RepID=A0A1M6CHN7_9FIRM|nr:M20 family metallopeptidase [Desulfofundulus thermosubterraneus]SHI60532.1 succinyl-diaminopimelate desuccinylase [Desulfofundulus thermosubterraneus DSM 16057]
MFSHILASEYMDQGKIFDVLVKSIQINTVNPPGNEEPLALYLAEQMRRIGLEVMVESLEKNRANVVGVLKGRGDKPALLYNGHLDTVPTGGVGWEYDPLSGQIVGDRVYGRGAADMKSGLVAMIMAAGILKAAGVELAGDLIVAGTAGEEVDSVGAKRLLQSGVLNKVGAVIIGEPSNNNIYVAEKGALWLKITTYGKTAHGSMPEEGKNAILMMNTLINELQRYNFRFMEHPLLGKPSLNIGTISGGIKTNVVPDKCVLTVDIRTVPGMAHQEILRDIQDILEEQGLEAEVEIINDRPSVDTPMNHELVKMGEKVASQTLGREVAIEGVSYYTDAAVLIPPTKLPFFIFGPGEARLAHQPNEYIEISKLLEAISFYCNFAIEYLR